MNTRRDRRTLAVLVVALGLMSEAWAGCRTRVEQAEASARRDVQGEDGGLSDGGCVAGTVEKACGPQHDDAGIGSHASTPCGAGCPEATVCSHDRCVSPCRGEPRFAVEPIRISPLIPEANSLGVGDFNGDGREDLAVGSLQMGQPVQILFALGGGSFREPVPIDSGEQLARVVVRDFDGDGELDLAGTLKQTNEVGVLRGDGSGHFAAAVRYRVGQRPGAIEAGDFNGDGRLDLVTTNFESGTVSLLLGAGGGTFQNALESPVGEQPTKVAAGDLNQDGRDDLVVSTYAPTSTGTTAVFLGRAEGPLQRVASWSDAMSVVAMGLADMDLDGHLDLVTTQSLPDPAIRGARPSVLVRFGDGGGRFPNDPVISGGIPGGLGGPRIDLRDLDLDGLPDAMLSFETSVATLRGRGDGTFENLIHYETALGKGAFVVGEFDGAPPFDIAVIEGFRPYVGVLFGRPGGGFRVRTAYEGGPGAPVSVLARDFDRDGVQDLLTVNRRSRRGNLGLMLGTGRGTFHPSRILQLEEYPMAGDVADFDEDGRLDVAVLGSRPVLEIVLGRDDGTWREPTRLPLPVPGYSVKAADVNGDAHIDLLIANHSHGQVTLMFGKGDGTFGAPQTLVEPEQLSKLNTPAEIAIEDLNHDHIPDLLVATSAARGLSVLLGRGGGAFAQPVAYPGASDSISITSGDFDEDGHPDAFIASFQQRNATLYLGNGDGTMRVGVVLDIVAHYASPYDNRSSARFVRSADLDGDGHLDLVVSTENREFSVFRGNGDGSFRGPEQYLGGRGEFSFDIADFDGDLRPDLAIGSYDEGFVSVILAECTAP